MRSCQASNNNTTRVSVHGVWIDLTEAQIKKVTTEIKKREKCRGDFKKMLLKLGFVTCEIAGKNCFEHKYYGWFAEIIEYNSRWFECWIVGTGLRDGGFPGGWSYGEPEEVEKVLTEAMDKLNNKDNG